MPYSFTMTDEKKVLVFGTFDSLHDGHRFFLREARRLGSRLIASLATDEVVQRIKGSVPSHHLEERLQALEASGLVDLAVAGDKTLGNWSTLKQCEPDIIAVGYDQKELTKALTEFIEREKLSIKLFTIDAHKPDQLHSRLLRKN